MRISPSLSEMQRDGFPVGGEASVALDLIDTVVSAHSSAVDLLAENAETWWRLESPRLPESAVPPHEATHRLRSALRLVVEACIDGRPEDGKAIDELNRFADSAPSNPRLIVKDGRPRVTTTWHPRRDANLGLAAIAQDAIELIGAPERSALLRRCANPTCSMVFLAENPRRIWCAPNICGNRARVSRHQQQQRRTAKRDAG